MFFGSTTFAAAPFAGVGITNITILATGNQINTAIGNVTVDLNTPVNVTGNQINLAGGSVSVITWNPIPPGVNQTWIPIDPLNP